MQNALVIVAKGPPVIVFPSPAKQNSHVMGCVFVKGCELDEDRRLYDDGRNSA
jgi:hypothetical protein